MSKGAINFSDCNDYFTPKEIVQRFGSFDYDPATTKEQASRLGIKNYDTIESDGLKTDWRIYEKIWINPPFTLKKEFLAKAVETFKDDCQKQIYLLLPISFLTTRTFYELVRNVGGRYTFQMVASSLKRCQAKRVSRQLLGV